jgi:ankyrin repeat protein
MGGNRSRPASAAGSGGDGGGKGGAGRRRANTYVNDREINCGLVRAAADGRLDQLRSALDSGANPNHRYSKKERERAELCEWTALTLAARGRRLDIGRELLKKGADADLANGEHLTPLMLACQNGDVQFAGLVRPSRAAPPRPRARARPDSPSQLLSNHADASAQAPMTRNAGDNAGLTALHAATAGGSAELVNLLVGNGAELDVPDRRGRTPLMVAAAESKTQIAELLVECGANAAMKDREGATAADIADRRGNSVLANRLRQAALQSPEQLAELRRASVARGGAAAAQRDDLWQACRGGDMARVESLVGGGASVNARSERKDGRGETPLTAAVRGGQLRVVHFLLEHGADPLLVNGEDMSPLMVAADCGHEAVAVELMRRGGSVLQKNKAGRTALSCAVAQRRRDMAKLLVKSGADVNAQLEDGNTPLHLAAAQGDDAMVALLMSLGADAELLNNKGESALDVASAAGHEHVAEALSGSGRRASGSGSESRSRAGSGAGPQRRTAKEDAMAALVDMLNAKGLAYKRDDDNFAMYFSERMGEKDERWRCFFRVADQVIMVAHMLNRNDESVPEERRRQVANLVLRINFTLDFGVFELNLNSGALMLREAFVFSTSARADLGAYLFNMLQETKAVFTAWLPAVLAVLDGEDPEPAFEAARRRINMGSGARDMLRELMQQLAESKSPDDGAAGAAPAGGAAAPLAKGAGAGAGAAVVDAGQADARWKDFQLPPERLQVDLSGAPLAKSIFGRVFSGKVDGREVRVHALSSAVESSSIFEEEMRRQVSLKHANVARTLGMARVGGVLVIVSDCPAVGTLHEKLATEAGRNDRAARLRWVHEIAQAMAYLHRTGQLHSSLSSSSVLVGADGVARVVNFGLGRFMRSAEALGLSSIAATAPELLDGDSSDSPQAADVYSFGMCMYEALTLREPFSDLKLPSHTLLRKVLGGLRPKFPDATSPAVAALISKCWHADPGHRPSFTDILAELQQIQ